MEIATQSSVDKEPPLKILANQKNNGSHEHIPSAVNVGSCHMYAELHWSTHTKVLLKRSEHRAKGCRARDSFKQILNIWVWQNLGGFQCNVFTNRMYSCRMHTGAHVKQDAVQSYRWGHSDITIFYLAWKLCLVYFIIFYCCFLFFLKLKKTKSCFWQHCWLSQCIMASLTTKGSLGTDSCSRLNCTGGWPSYSDIKLHYVPVKPKGCS